MWNLVRRLWSRLFGVKLKPSGHAEVQWPPSDETVYFGYKMNWFAIRSEDTAAVVKVIGLTATEPLGWLEGLKRLRLLKGAVFVSPPYEGWVFVVGVGLPYPVDADRGDRTGDHLKIGSQFRRLFQALAERFGDVQFFGNHRVSDFAAWAKAENGQVVRVFSHAGSSGEVYANYGAQTVEEAELGLIDPGLRPPAEATGYLFEAEEDDANARLRAFPGEHDVVDLAGLWSVNPLDLSEPAGVGVLGVLELD